MPDFVTSGTLAVDNSKINDCQYGLYQNGGTAYAHDTEFDGNGNGADLYAGNMTTADSSVHKNYYGVLVEGAGECWRFIDRIVYNTQGVNVGGGTMFSSSPGTNLITPGQIATGTLGTVRVAIRSPKRSSFRAGSSASAMQAARASLYRISRAD